MDYNLHQLYSYSYLSTLKERIRTAGSGDNNIPKVGGIVQINADKKKRIFWPIGIITKINLGRDKKIHSVQLKIKNNITITRSVSLIFPLEIYAFE